MERKVVRGPFAGLRLSAERTWSDYDTVSKLIGSYECELHNAVDDIVARTPDGVINVGAADGYYAFGMKRLLPNAATFTVEIDRTFDAAVADMAKLNSVSVEPVIDFSFSDPGPVISALSLPAFVVDCEGCEAGIVHMPGELRKRSLFLIELHEMFVPGVTEALAQSLSETHAVTLIDPEPRDPRLYPELADFHEIEAFLLLWEFRATNRWLYARPIEGAA